VNNIIADENPEIMKWLSPLDPRGRHHDVHTDRVDGVGNWLLETSEFQEGRSYEGGVNGCLILQRESGSGENISKVSSRSIWKK